MLKEALFFPDKSGILFRQTFGKALRGDGENAFAVRRCENNILCPVKNFVRYLSLCRLMGLDLQSGFLFCTTCGNFVTEQPFVGSGVYNRLKLYLQKINADKGETPSVLGQDALLHFLCWESIRKIFLDMWAGLALAWLISTVTSGTPLSQALRQRL